MEVESKSLNVKLYFINMKAAIVYFKQKYGKVPTDLRAVTITAPKAAPAPVAAAPASIQEGEYLNDIPEDILEEYLGETAPVAVVPAPASAPVAEADLNRYIGVIYAAGLHEKNVRGFGRETHISMSFGAIRNKNGLFPVTAKIYKEGEVKTAGEAEALAANEIYKKYSSHGKFLIVMRTVSSIEKLKKELPGVDIIHLENIPESLQGDKGRILSRAKRLGSLLGKMTDSKVKEQYYNIAQAKY